MPDWKPNREEAQFLGEVLNIDAGLAGVVRDQLAAGRCLSQVQAALKGAMKIVAAARGEVAA